MSGILDSKSRIIDTVITTEGRRQLAFGGIDIQYVTFTDGAAYYRADVASGSQDATRRVYLEACQLPQDNITFQADADGNLEPFQNSLGVSLSSGKILEYSLVSRGSSSWSQTVTSLKGDQFAERSAELLDSSVDNFRKMYLIASRDTIFDEDRFALAPDDVTFTITDDRPLRGTEQHAGHLTSMDSVHTDPRFSEKKNFRFMPPINRLDDASLDRSDYRALARKALGSFRPLGRTQSARLTWPQLSHELRYYGDQGYSRVINFDPTSSDNQLVGQFFERSDGTLKKLDVVDHGTHLTGNPAAPVVRVFFVGKVEVDEKGTDTFVHLFTLVFE